MESSRYEAWRVGEFLWPWVTKYFCQLGIPDRVLEEGHRPCYSTQSAWGTEDLEDRSFIFEPYGIARSLDRRRFDATFAQTAEAAGATILRAATVTSVKRGSDRWRVEIEHTGGCEEVHAAFLVDATGRARTVVRNLGPRWLSYDQEIGLVGLLSPRSKEASSDETLLLEATENGWWYSLPLPNGSILVAFMTESAYLASSSCSPTELWREELRRTVHSQSNAKGYALNEDVRVRPASTGRLDRAAGPGWVAIGDSASTFDPLTGSGIPKAVQYALIATHSIGKKTTGYETVLDEYAKGVVADFETYLEQRTAYYQMERRWPESPFWRQRQTKPEPRSRSAIRH